MSMFMRRCAVVLVIAVSGLLAVAATATAAPPRPTPEQVCVAKETAKLLKEIDRKVWKDKTARQKAVEAAYAQAKRTCSPSAAAGLSSTSRRCDQGADQNACVDNVGTGLKPGTHATTDYDIIYDSDGDGTVETYHYSVPFEPPVAADGTLRQTITYGCDDTQVDNVRTTATAADGRAVTSNTLHNVCS